MTITLKHYNNIEGKRTDVKRGKYALGPTEKIGHSTRTHAWIQPISLVQSFVNIRI